MIWSRRLLFGIVCLLAIGMNGFERHRVAAATHDPTVTIRRNPVFVGPVRTGDFNGDGFADLVGSTADPANPSGPTVVTVGLSKADGSLGTLMRTHVNGTVLAVGDLNADGKLDVLVRKTIMDAGQTSADLLALRGNGDGTFATSSSVVMSVSYVFFALIADFDGDGHLDVAAAVDNDGDDNVVIQQGHGDFTFTFARDLGGGTDTPFAGTVADLNGDGKADIVTANGEFNSLSFYLNQGALQFTSSQMTLAHVANDIAAADLNGDGRVDLVIAASDDPHPAYQEGYATVLRGTGNGAFAAPVDYPTAPGAYNVVLGDFNRDGIIDIATANRSEIYYDALCDPRQTWDSVSVLPGTTSGTFTARSDFSIGNQMKPHDTNTDRNTVESLASGDLNGDHAADLVTSNGTVFLNKAADPNWAPTVDAGPDQTVNDPGDHFVHLYASASDVDQDMLTYAWFDSGGDSIPPVPSPCFSPHTLGIHTYTVVVDDGHGHTATDSMQVDFGSDGGGGGSTSLGVIAPAVGTTIVAGRPYEIKFHIDDSAQALYEWSIDYSTDDGATWNHIWECHNAGRSSGPGVPTSRDESCTWENPGPPSAHARMVVYAQDDADQPIGTQGTTSFAIEAVNGAVPDPWRHQDVGAVAVGGSATASDATSFSVTASGADIWGTADEFHFLYQPTENTVSPSDGGSWEITTRVARVQNTDAWTKAGLMIREGLGASARHASVFVSPGKGVAFQRRTSTGGASVSTTGPALVAPVWLKLGVQSGIVTAYYRKNLADPWTVIGRQTFTEFASVDTGMAVTSHHDGQPASADFDSVDVHVDPNFVSNDVGTTGGSTTSDGVITTMTAKGTDVWGTSDQFRYASAFFGSSSGSITARVRSVQNVNAWTKAGVMFRELSATGTVDANAKYVFVMVSPGHGVTMHTRSATGGAAASVATAPIPGTAPGWVRLSRNGDTFTGAWSSDGVTWTTVGTATASFAATHGSNAGLALTSHSGSTATASFDEVVIQQ